MSLEAFGRIVASLGGAIERIHLQGLGEPFLNRDFFQMAEHAARTGIEVTASTNLTVLNEETALRCVSSGISLLHISIDGPEESTYEAIRKGASFDRLIANLKLLIGAKSSLGSSTPVLHMTMVVMRQNLASLPEIVRLAYRFQFAQVFVQQLCHSFEESTLPLHYLPMRSFVRDQALTGETPAAVGLWFGQARSVARELGIDLRLPAMSNEKGRKKDDGDPPCDWPWKGIYISHDGYVMPCCMVSTPDRVNFGNIHDHGILDIWSGEAYEAFRAELLSERPPEVCQSCSLYKGIF